MKGKPEVWNPRTWDILDRRWGEGLSTSKIGVELGVSKNSIVSQARTRHLPKRPNPIRQITEALRQHILTLRASGTSQADIIRETGSSIDTLKSVFARAGVERPKSLREERVSPERVMPRPPPPSTLPALPSEVAEVVVEVAELVAEAVAEAVVDDLDWDFTEYEASLAREAQARRERWQCRYMVGQDPWVRCSEQVKDAETPYCKQHHKLCFTTRD